MDITDVNSNIKMLEECLRTINEELTDAQKLVAMLKKDGSQPSPGLVASIATLRNKQENFMDSLELWRCMKKVYPNYDR